jgi:hypothetical protein
LQIIHCRQTLPHARAAVRTTSNNIEAAITSASDLAGFMALYETPVDADGNPTGNAPINNWPDAIVMQMPPIEHSLVWLWLDLTLYAETSTGTFAQLCCLWFLTL